MKFLHTADLHIGKRVNEFSMLEDQRYILGRIFNIACDVKADAVLAAGDLYDRSVPLGEAVSLLDDFITALSEKGIAVCAVSGNHDSPERLDFGSRIMGARGVHIAGTFKGRMEKVTFTDSYGEVYVYLLPFIKPAAAEPFFGAEKTGSYFDAVSAAVGASGIDTSKRNVLVAHQFVTSSGEEPLRCDSETVSVGGVDNVDVSAFSPFDYAALGHLHGAQSIGRGTVRYSGSPLKYSFSEAHQEKSVTVAELGEKGKITLTSVPLVPLHGMREIKGPIGELTSPAVVSQGDCRDYVRAVLTDEDEVTDAVGKLRAVYPNIMRIDFENRRTAGGDSQTCAYGDVKNKTPAELFGEFYKSFNNVGLSQWEEEKIKETAEKAVKEEIL